ncbi:MAG TPA: ATP-binding protein [Alphaproteobacteria bacterium]|jgi:PAS domain S-box-containing protein|nr:ATP-binding protein [Alphaproteobacteria bacterium]
MSGEFLSSFALFDADHRLVEWNEDFAREYLPVGVSLHKGMSYREMLEAAAKTLTTEQIFAGHPAVRDPRQELMDRLAGFGLERTSEYKNGNGRIIRIEERRSLSGGILRYAHDVTDEREAGSVLLRASRQQLDAGATDLSIAQVEMRRSPDGVYDIPPIPESVRRLLEFTEDMVGKDPMIVYTRMIGGAEPLNFRVQLEEAAKNLLICSFEYRVLDGKDRVRWIRQSMMPHPQSDGSMLFTGAMRDITREREAEDQVELLRSVVVRSTDSIAVFESDPGAETTILYVNDKFTELFGGTAEALIGQPIDVMGGNDINGLGAKLMNEALARDDGDPVEYETGGRDGRVFWVEMRVKTVQKLENGGARWVVISRDITERRHVQDELQRAKEQAEASNRAKGDFLANMSHELRTPLNAIIGFTELIEHGIAQTGWTDSYKEYLADVSGSGRHLLELINTILDLSKIEAGQLELDLEPVDLCELTRTSLALVAGMAHDGRITVTTDIPETCPEFRGDFLKLKQVLLNIFSNAIKFTPAGGKVAVRVTFSQSRAAVVVSDTGCGIPAADLKRVTLPFVQVASSLSRKYGGSGLGLSIARQLCTLHGGNLTIRSTEGRGTTVRITLPLAAKQAANQDHAAISAAVAARS